MKTKRITERVVARARSRAARYEITCGALPGFILRVLPSGKKVYYVRYRASGRDTRERIGLTTEWSLRDARQRALERLMSSRAGSLPSPRAGARGAVAPTRRALPDEEAPASPLLREFAARFLSEHVDRRLKPASRYKYRQLLRTMILPSFGARRLHELERAEVIQWHGARARTPSEANNGLVVLKSLYSRAIEWGVLPSSFTSPATRVKRFPETPRERFLTPEERARLEECFAAVLKIPFGNKGGFRWETIGALRLLSHTGMRRGEALRLQWSMIDWNHRVIYLPDSKTGRRAIPLSSAALEILEEARARGNPSPFVFPSSKGTAIQGVTLSKSWMRVRARVGLEDVRLHDLRHSAASDAICSGVPLAIVGKILGHRKASTTQRYAHLSDEALHAGVEQMGRAITRNSRRGKSPRPKKKKTTTTTTTTK